MNLRELCWVQAALLHYAETADNYDGVGAFPFAEEATARGRFEFPRPAALEALAARLVEEKGDD